MTFSGIVRGGVVVLENGQELTEGLRVEVVVPEASSKPSEIETPPLAGLLAVAGTVRNLPADFAAQHDHYLHGTARR